MIFILIYIIINIAGLRKINLFHQEIHAIHLYPI